MGERSEERVGKLDQVTGDRGQVTGVRYQVSVSGIRESVRGFGWPFDVTKVSFTVIKDVEMR